MLLTTKALALHEQVSNKYISSWGVVLRAGNGDIFVIANNEKKAERVREMSGIRGGKVLFLTPKTHQLPLHLSFLGAIGLLDREAWGTVYTILQ